MALEQLRAYATVLECKDIALHNTHTHQQQSDMRAKFSGFVLLTREWHRHSNKTVIQLSDGKI